MAKASKKVLVTKEGLKKLEDELVHLEKVVRKEVASELKVAIAFGDLSENAEYSAAKDKQAFTERRILELEEMLKNVEIIKGTGGKSVAKIVQLGSTVQVKDASKKDAETETFTLVGSTEADPFSGKISNESPLGSALLESKEGDTVKFTAPKGEMAYKVLKLK